MAFELKVSKVRVSNILGSCRKYHTGRNTERRDSSVSTSLQSSLFVILSFSFLFCLSLSFFPFYLSFFLVLKLIYLLFFFLFKSNLHWKHFVITPESHYWKHWLFFPSIPRYRMISPQTVCVSANCVHLQ